jgi:hypothetical protein
MCLSGCRGAAANENVAAKRTHASRISVILMGPDFGFAIENKATATELPRQGGFQVQLGKEGAVSAPE